MKKSTFFIAFSILVLLTLGIWYLYLNKTNIITENFNFIMVIFIVGFGTLFGIRRWKSANISEFNEDELSRKIMQKASSISYYISIYLWLALMFIKDEFKMETVIVLWIGILGMVISLAVTWLLIHRIGIKNE